MILLLNDSTKIFYLPKTIKEAITAAERMAKSGHKIKIVSNATVSHSWN